MILTYNTSIFINQDDGKFNIKLKDTSVWPVGGVNRADIALAFVVHKIDLIGAPPTEFPAIVVLDAVLGGRVIQNPLLTNETRTEIDFIVGSDGYHRTYMFAMSMTPTNTDGDVYYYPLTQVVRHRVAGVYIDKTLEQAIAEEIITVPNNKHFPANPRTSVRLDSIAEKYSKGRSGSSDSDFKLWTTLYIQLYGALLSFDKQAYFEYERKIRAANRLF